MLDYFSKLRFLLFPFCRDCLKIRLLGQELLSKKYISSFLLYLLIPLLAFAQENPKMVIDSVNLGQISIDEGVEKLLSTAENFPDVITQTASVKSAILLGMKEVLADALPKRILKLAGKKRTEDLRGFSTLASAVFEQGEQALEEVRNALLLVSKIDQAESQGEQGLKDLIRSGGSDQEKTLAKARLESRASSAKAKSENDINIVLNNRNPYEVVELLFSRWKTGSLIKADDIFPPLNTAVQEIRKRVVAQNQNELALINNWLSQKPDAFEFVVGFSVLNEALKSPVIDILERLILNDTANGREKSVTWCLKKLILIRPDPSEQNDALRLKVLDSAKMPELESFAIGMLADLRARGVGIGSLSKVQYAIRGYYGFWTSFVAIGLLLIGLLAFFGFVGFFAFNNYARAKDEENLTWWERKKKVDFLKDKNVQDEYGRLLEFFGLSDTATETMIKKAYRDAVKKTHPDTQSAADGEATSEEEADKSFEEIQEKYERLMQMRQGRFDSKR